MTEQEQLTRILTLVELTNSRLDQLDRDIRETNQRIEKENQETKQRIEATNQRIEEEVKRWDERFFNLVKEQGQTARTIIITAASVVVLSPVLGAVVELVEKFVIK
ncbi:hypothetical protein [Crocosphaera watsonii]|uniref:Uncharacterized protein n=3 Tax=Crocosphaera watsonii TaxID=263511 RepID=T2JV81_CROWT|nr:hypothetical protein [Crocosphaera watsonii]EHJ09270.1 hypothetical protein CWATWH0003_B305 [Crocosphaera watsonii WH 0003]CCQ56639.1 hypothetical protein CWATWH0005_5849 [Crocosphaera watsonii WH 0005]CCQ68984.1 hypothetical protein CWATWH0402_4510 [Crocosphaera watsonii WH 0402]